MVNINCTIFLNPHENKQGKHKLYLQISIKRKIKRYPLNLYVEKKDFCSKTKLLKSGKDKHIINRMILAEINNVNEIYLKLRESKVDISFKSFEKLYFNLSDTTLYDVADLHCKNLTNISQKPIQTVIKELAQIDNDLYLDNINLSFIQQYNELIKNKANNTIWCKHKVLKSLINTAIKNDLYKKENPYKKFKINYIQTDRIYLSLEELKQVEKLIIDNNIPVKVVNAAKAFLFQCYTGLRYSDIVNLKFKDIQDNAIRMKIAKTQEFIYIPLSGPANNIVENIKHDQENIFNIPSNQKYNDHLKLVALYSGSNKNITSHVARHTFATISIALGMPIEIISKLLGHKELKTTKIYSKILDPLLKNNISLWDQIYNHKS
jgi:integrase/recombinase XerC